jgi:hypothetical protein
MADAFSTTRITTNATTANITGGAVGALLHGVIVAQKGATGNLATIYDATTATGTPIMVLDTTSQVGFVPIDRYMLNGITVVTATGTAGELIVVWR